MKVKINWKDPDYCNAVTGEWVEAEGEDDENLRLLGMNENLVVEFDTDAMTATVLPRRKRP